MLASGWETTVFEFRLASRSARVHDLPLEAPLVLRFYEGSRADDKGAREALTIRHLADAGYPVPYPYLFEPDHAALGAPFLIMQRVGGSPLFTTDSFPQALKTFSLGFIAFVRAQVRLHRIASAGIRLESFPRAYRISEAPQHLPLLDRLLAIIRDRIDRAPLLGLRDAFMRLCERAPQFRAAPEALVHMDYHPQNVIVQGLRVSGVIDWVNADCGDRHLCAATTSVILSTSAMERPRWMRDNAIGNTLRAFFAALYIPLYHALAPMELARFRYCQAVAAMLRLSMFGMMRVRGPESVGFRPEAIENVTPAVVRLLSRYAGRKSGLPLSIPEPN